MTASRSIDAGSSRGEAERIGRMKRAARRAITIIYLLPIRGALRARVWCPGSPLRVIEQDLYLLSHGFREVPDVTPQYVIRITRR